MKLIRKILHRACLRKCLSINKGQAPRAYNKLYRQAFIITTLILFFSYAQSEIFSEKKIQLDNAEKTRRKEKLKKLNIKSFINRNNERADEKTRKAHFETGKKLANRFMTNPESTFHNGISVQRFETKEEGLLGADVLEFTKEASYGHINAIVRVVSGYVSGMYEYNQEDAELLALYVIYYNRKHRGDMEYLRENFYQNDIVKKERLGIPEKFDGWRGQTQILIPVEKNLTKGGGFDIATFELENQVNPDIDAGNQKKFAKFQNKKNISEKEEVQAKYDAIEKKEKQLLSRKSEIEDKLAELKKDPEKNKEEIVRLEAEKKKIEKELETVAVEKKNLQNKLEQIARREEMRKLGITSEKEYLAYLASQKKKEDPIEPVKTVEVEEKKVEEIPKPIAEEQHHTVFEPPQDLNFWQSYHLEDKRFIAGRESCQLLNSRILTIGYELPYNEKTELMVFLISSGQHKLLKSTEGIRLNSNSPLLCSEDKVFIFEIFNGMNYLTQLNSDLDFEFRSSHPIHLNSLIQVEGDKIRITKKEKTGSIDDVLFFSQKDLRLIQ